jgi:LCP family protein required for cell wall assembly
MVLHLNQDHQGASLISFPRDMKVPIEGHGTNKINSAYAFGGGPLAVTTLENLLGVRINHVAVINFDGFVALTEQLGGVTVDNPYASESRGFKFPAGSITLQGDQALAYVSEIDELPGGDASRTERQRLVMQAMFSKVASKGMLLNPVKFNQFMGSAAQQVSVDQNLTTSQLRDTGMSVRFNPADLLSIEAPDEDAGSAQLAELKTALRDDTVADYAARHPNG